MFWLLEYQLADDYLERRPPLRSAHLALAKAANASGALLYAGAVEDPADRAVLIFEADEPSLIEEFARHDPYVEEGLVEEWSIRRWNVVIGPGIEPPA
jgi:hypothetical protein